MMWYRITLEQGPVAETVEVLETSAQSPEQALARANTIWTQWKDDDTSTTIEVQQPDGTWAEIIERLDTDGVLHWEVV